MADNHNQTNISPIQLQIMKSLPSEMLAFVFDDENILIWGRMGLPDQRDPDFSPWLNMET